MVWSESRSRCINCKTSCFSPWLALSSRAILISETVANAIIVPKYDGKSNRRTSLSRMSRSTESALSWKFLLISLASDVELSPLLGARPLCKCD
jgi:hypothetical protein